MISIKTLFFGGSELSEKQEKIRMLFMYLFCGGMTTVINMICFIVFDILVKAELEIQIFSWKLDLFDMINQCVAWVVSVLSAYFMNRAFVFLSKGNILRELLSFAAARLATFFIFELGTFELMILFCEKVMNCMKDSAFISIASFDITYLYLIKFINLVLLTIANYYFSKLMVFRKQDRRNCQEEA